MSTTPLLLDQLLQPLNAPQRAGVQAPLQASLCVQAGAGTGKTEFISRRFVKLAYDLAAMGVANPTEHLWVSTFTEKAAKEMAGRIQKLLVQTGAMPLADSAWIGTFHGLCQRMLSASQPQHSPEVPFTLVDDIESELIREDMLRGLLDGSYGDISEALSHFGLSLPPNLLSPEALVALDLDDYESLFTSVLFQVIPRLKASGLSPQGFYHGARQQIGAFTQLIQTMPNGAHLGIPHFTEHVDFARAWVSHLSPVRHDTYRFEPTHWQVSRDTAKALSKNKNAPAPASMLKDALKPLYDHGCFVTYNGRRRKAPFSPPEVGFDDLNRAAALEAKLLDVVVALFAVFQFQLEQSHRMDFDDLIHRVVVRLEIQPQVRAQFADQFAHFMVDEFQDSNGLQLRLIQQLAGAQAPPLTVVGDKKQSIYGFRYAQPENLSVLFHQVPQAQTVSLQTNYRSSSVILDFANRVTAMMGLSGDETLLAASQEPAPAVQWLQVPEGLTKRQALQREEAWIVREIEGFIAQQAFEPKDVAILVESHKKAKSMELALKAAGIPAIRQRLLGFFEDPVVQQAVHLLKLLQNPQDDVAWIGFWQHVVSHRQLVQLAQAKRAQAHPSFAQVLLTWGQDASQTPEDWAPYQGLLQTLAIFLPVLASQAADLRLSGALSQLVERLGPFLPAWQSTQADAPLPLLHRVLVSWEEATRKPLLFDAALTRLLRYHHKNRLDVPLGDEDDWVGGNAVKILTLHASKGLEFPVVFLAAVEDARSRSVSTMLTVDPQYDGKLGVGLLLNQFEGETTLKKTVYDCVWRKPREEEEALRRLYVAVTRPRQRLYLSTWHKSLAWLQPSLFEGLNIQYCFAG